MQPAAAQVGVHRPERQHGNAQARADHGFDRVRVVEPHDDAGVKIHLNEVAIDHAFHSRSLLEKHKRVLVQLRGRIGAAPGADCSPAQIQNPKTPPARNSARLTIRKRPPAPGRATRRSSFAAEPEYDPSRPADLREKSSAGTAAAARAKYSCSGSGLSRCAQLPVSAPSTLRARKRRLHTAPASL